jgi:serine/threonine protein kinase
MQVRYGPYVIEASIGKGGMGEVYRARDTRLDRLVAIKVLTARPDDGSHRLQRIMREARIISRLNHPHICTLHDVGDHDGITYLVMEYLHGETLGQRLLRGAIPLDEVLRSAIEIAAALDHAHCQGVLHRDLKPANIMLTPSGVKLLDFGIAKLWTPEPSPETSPVSPADTVTEEGTLVGTTPYMAPEQLEAQPGDARSDIFAFGAVLYEMAAGRAAFAGASKASIIAAVLNDDPTPVSDVRREVVGAERASTARDTVPALLDQIVARCLAKDPGQRWQSASDLKQALTWVNLDAQSLSKTPSRVRHRRTPWLIAAASLVLASAASLVLAIWPSRPASDARPVTFAVAPPDNATLSPSPAFMSVAPDGHSLAFVASFREDPSSLWIRSLDSLTTRRLPNTAGAAQPFWSPDSRFLAFFKDGKLMKINVASGLTQTIDDAPGQTGTWNQEGTILRGRPRLNGIYRLSAGGGPSTLAIALDPSRQEIAHNFPQFLPDGRHFLFIAWSTQPEYDDMLYVGSLDSQARTAVLKSDSNATYVPPGYLLFVHEGALVAQPFDAKSFRATGEPVSIVEQIDINPGSHRAAFSASQTGVLAYRPMAETELTWFDRAGRRLGSVGPPGYYSSPALSPDDRQVAVTRADPATATQDIWITDLDHGTSSRLTFDKRTNQPLWTPDGHRVAFKLGKQVVEKASSGTGEEEVLLELPAGGDNLLDWTADGRGLMEEGLDQAGYRLRLLPLLGDRTAVPLVDSGFENRQGRLSPNGRWLAYVSNESGQYDVFVRTFPTGEQKWRVSDGGGLEPQWRRDGNELFFLTPGGTLMAVPVSTSKGFVLGLPARMFETKMSSFLHPYVRSQYAVAADGQRFLINQPTGRTAPIVVIVNWQAALTAREKR